MISTSWSQSNLAAFPAGNGPALGSEAVAELTLDTVRARWRQFLDHQPARATVTVAELAGRLCGSMEPHLTCGQAFASSSHPFPASTRRVSSRRDVP